MRWWHGGLFFSVGLCNSKERGDNVMERELFIYLFYSKHAIGEVSTILIGI